jgi:coproporphyrinogen III oxidase-like Fe-S oxidoreductase
MNEQENKAIKRGNNFPKIVTAFQKVQERNIPFEVSIIYGLPYQTVSSFLQSIEQLKNLGCTSITAFPLMLLKGTELYDLKHYFNFREVPMGKYNIPTVVESNFFSENEWYQMQEIALKLNSNDRI